MVPSRDDLHVVMKITQEVDPCGVDDWLYNVGGGIY